jgi:hypothetical protein
MVRFTVILSVTLYRQNPLVSNIQKAILRKENWAMKLLLGSTSLVELNESPYNMI